MQGEELNCTYCGTALPIELKVCSSCGTPVPESEPIEHEEGATLIAPAGKAEQETQHPAAGKSRDPEDDVEEDATLLAMPGKTPRAADVDQTLVAGSTGSAGDATLLGARRETPTQGDADLTMAAAPARSSDDTGTLAPGTPAPASGASGPDGDEEREGPLAVGQPFGERYVILKMLGVGGMGAVYQAWDQELGVPVALKVIRAEMSQDPVMAEEMSARFKRELILARDVTHKNVVRIHDLGELEGMKFFTMAFVKGTELSSLLEDHGRLPIERALEIIRQVVDGMIAAHEKGVVHRDLKPENIMIDEEGRALLMDFGIARSETQQGQEAVAAAQIDPRTLETKETVNLGKTMAGAIVGTLEYMAPEQFQGKVADQRADVYALGLILYDMILGRNRAGSAQSAVKEVQNRIAEPPPSARSIDPDVHDALDAVIERCLHPNPEDRFQSTVELKEALDRLDGTGKPLPKYSTRAKLLIGLAATVMVAALAGTYYLASGRVVVEPEPMTVLIADFVNDTGDSTFSGAVEQTLGIALEQASFVSNFARGNAARTAQQLREGGTLDEDMSFLISKREGLDAVVVGRVEPSGNGYRLTAEVRAPGLEAFEDQPLARASARARDRDAVLAAINAIGAELRRELGDRPREGAEQVATETVTAASLEAMHAYAEGQEYSYQGRLEEAVASFERAVAEDPAFGRAYAAMATQYSNLRRPDRAQQNYQLALQHLDRMTERERYRTMGAYYLGVSRNYEKAIENLEQLVESYPADRTGHMNLAYASVMVRDFDRAVAEQALALELDPNSLIQRINYAMYAMYAGSSETAIENARKIAEDAATQEGGLANRMRSDALFVIGRSSASAGDLATARASFAQMKELGLNRHQATIGLADIAMYQGLPEAALEIVDPFIDSFEREGKLDQVVDALLIRAEALLLLGREREAVDAALSAAERGTVETVLYPAARVLLQAGQTERALEIAIQLENMLQSQTISYAQLIRGEISLLQGRLLPATEALTDAGEQYDSWFAHLLLGRAYLRAGLGPDALNELVQAVERKGEMTDFFIVDGATLRYWPDALYWLAQAQEMLGSDAAALQSYEAFLEIRGDGIATDLTSSAAARSSELRAAA